MMEAYHSELLKNIPKNWQTKPIREINTYRNVNINPYEFKDEIFEYYSIPAYQTGQTPLFTKGIDIQSNKLLFDEGTVVFGKLNPRVEKVWRIGCHSKCRKIGTTEWIAVKPNNDLLPDFLYFLEWSDFVMPLAKIFVTGSTPSRQRVDPSSFYKINIPVPPLPEQRRIAYILCTVQKAIEQQYKLIRVATELKKALMQKLFTEGTKGEKQKMTEIGLVPESWEVQPFENTGEVVYGIQAAVASNLKPVGHKILTNKNITLDGKIDLEKINYFELSSKRHFATILKKGDLLFNWRSGSKEHVGKTAIFDLEENEYVHSSFILRIRVNENHNAHFLFYYLNYLREAGYYQKVQTFSVNAKFNKSAINAMPIALPKKKVQDEIGSIISIIDKKIDNYKSKYSLLSSLFRTLLHELMTGTRRVHEIEFDKMPEAVNA